VVLTGSGTPTAAGAFVLTPKVGTSSCTFTVNVTAQAAFTLTGAPGACTGATVSGTYTANAALTASNTVTVQANVTTAGAYAITTNTVGGMTFSKSGTFASTGVQTVVLTGNGTPTTAGANVLTIANNGCTFTVTVAPPQSGGTTMYQCKVDGVLATFTDRAIAQTLDKIINPPLNTLYLDGYSGPGNNESEFEIFIDKNDVSVVGTGTYNVDGFAAINGYRLEVDFHKVNADQTVTLWNTSSSIPGITVNPPFTVTVTSVTATRIKGTFSGKLTDIDDGRTKTITITEGVFDLPIQN
jgi:carbon monoxide dehydrogenase subunit G